MDEFSPNSTLSHYRILSKLGAGGMGEVYLAQDTKLDRKVALKILPGDVAANHDRMERFVREAKSAAALNHPNIAHVYEISEGDGTNFIAMEFIDGETLREKIHRDRTPLLKLLKYLNQVAQGLSKAHAAGIVHRDLKPDNIMITRDGFAKVLDFGLAKLIERGGEMGTGSGGEDPTMALSPRRPISPSLSTPGIVMGTVGYMSPEQASGRVNEIDHRSDIFSFGCILFEAATGKRAFEGKDALDSLHKIVHAPTPQVKDVNPLAPAELQRVVRRCLAKEPEKRYQSIKELAIELDDLQEQLKGVTTSNYSASQASPTIQTTSGASRSDEGFWIAVLPFKVRDEDPEVTLLADGLSEEIVTGLSRFRYLSVVTSNSAARLKETEAGRALGTKLDTRYMIEGSIRKGGSAIRVSAQLVDTETGAQLWSETYNRDLQSSTIFAVQDDVAGRIVATVADSYGVLIHSMRAAIGEKDDAYLTPVEWQFQYFAYREQITPSAHAALKSRLERVVKQNDRRSDVWACLAQVYVDEYAFGFRDDATSLDRALAAGRRGVELDRANQFALVALAQVHFFRQDLAAFGPGAERAMALNPLNTDAIGILGLQIVHTGQFERGTAIVLRAMELNPNHAGWMHFAPLWDHFHRGEYEQALECANRVDVPGLFWPYLVMASACGHLGRRTEAEAAVKDLLAIDPEFAAHVRSNVESWHFASGLLEPLLEGLRKAGLEIIDEKPASTSSAASFASSETRADEGFWVAVLPFKYRGSNVDLEALAEGLSEDIVTGLSRFAYLKVVARSTTSSSTSESADARSIGKHLGARYVVEGSLRQAGSTLRMSVQLVDTITGTHLWAETYDRAFQPEAVFALQDELVPRIVSTVADQHGVLIHSIAEELRHKTNDQFSPYDAVLSVFGFHERMTPEEHAILREVLERVVRDFPDQGNCWAMLETIYCDEYMFGFNVRPDPLGRAIAAAQRAVELEPTSNLASQALAQALFFRRELVAFRPVAERTIALNPMDGATVAFMGLLFACSGDWEKGCAVTESAMQLNPHFPGWYRLASIFNAYRQKDYQATVDGTLRVNIPGYFWTLLMSAAAHGQLGNTTEAQRSLRELLKSRPEFASTARDELGKWFAPELIEHLIEGLQKAGLGAAAKLTSSPPSHVSLPSSESRSDEGFWVVVLPFKATGATTEVNTFAEALSEEITTGLSRFSYLRVIARSSNLQYASSTSDVRMVGKELGARYVIEGSLRQAGSKLRLAVQLVDSTTGAHLWAENYERTFTSEAIFDLQDDLVPRIVSTVADWYGVLPHSMSESVRLKPPDQLSPYEALLRSFGYFENINAEEHAMVRYSLERAVAQEPGNADGWAMLSMIFGEEHRFGFPGEPDSLGRSLEAARRAVSIAHANHFAWLALAQALFFRKEFDAFRDAAERAITLNPMDGSTVEYLAHLIAFSGDWERGCELAERARQLNPNHPSWYWSVPCLDAYRKGDYLGARPFLTKGNPQKNYLMHALLAAVQGQLGESESAARNLREVLTMMPDFPSIVRREFSKWYLPELVDHLMDGLRKAGLEIPDEGSTSTSSARSFVSSEARADEGFWVAVLPFRYRGSNVDLEALAEGLSEEIVTGFARFSYLRVIARSSTVHLRGEATDIRTVGKELGARYVMEGNLRQAGPKLRLAVQLIDATTGAHLWAENYERSFTQESLFELQDDLVPRIVSTVADQYGALVHSMSESLRGRSAGQYSPHEAMLRAFGYWERMTPEEHAEVRDILEAAVAVAPDHSDCLAELAFIYWHEYAFGYNLKPDPVGRARATAQRAVASAPTSHFAHCALATSLFFQKDYMAFRPAAERALALNRMDSSTAAILGNMIAYAGDWEYGLGIVERAMQLNPHHAGWYHYVAFCDAYRKHDYHGALESALKVNMPAYHWPLVYLSAVYGQLGEQQRASAALRELHALVPNFGAIAREEFGKWLDAELTEHLIDGLRKAGLEIVDEELASTSSSAAMVSSDSRADEGFWVAVLPFKFTGAAELASLAEGLSEEIVKGLSRFSYLRVIARSSTLRYAAETSDAHTIGKQLGASYLLEGSLRQVGSTVRIALQLVNTVSGAHIWAEAYDRPFQPEKIFELQDELVPRIVSTVADTYGVLPRTMSDALRTKDPERLTPYEAVLRSFAHFPRLSTTEHAAARASLERAVALAPNNADAWAILSMLYRDEYTQGFNVRPDAIGRALDAAQHAVEAAPSNHLAYHALASAQFFCRDFQAFRNSAERAITLNSNDGFTSAFLGLLTALSGDWERGLVLANRARDLNPTHPGWYWFCFFFDAYRKNDYSAALNFAFKINMPNFWRTHLAVAIANAQIGELAAARNAVREMLSLRPNFGIIAREELGKWYKPDLVEHIVDGLRKAGLEVEDKEAELPPTHLVSSEGFGISADKNTTTSAAKVEPASRMRSLFDARPAIAVLPFNNLSADPEQEYFADGLAEDLITRLSLWRSFPVIARNSSFAYKGDSIDSKKVSTELGVRYVVQGSVRKSANQVRISAQLIDATTGQHVWAKTYDRELTDVFAVQDEISEAIAASLIGDLERAEHSRVQRSAPDSLEAWGLYQRALPLIYNFTREDCSQARTLLASAVEHDPHFATGLARLAEVAVWEVLFEWTDNPEGTLDTAIAQARRAVAIDPLDAQARINLSFALMTAGDGRGALEESRQAVELNPSMPFALAIHAYHRHIGGYPPEESIELVQRALRLSPHDPVEWLFYDVLSGTYLNAGRFVEGLEAGRRLITLSPNYYWGYLWSAMNAVGLGQIEEARKLVDEARRVKPELSFELASKCLGTMAPDVDRRFKEALRQAGLEENRETRRHGDGETAG